MLNEKSVKNTVILLDYIVIKAHSFLIPNCTILVSTFEVSDFKEIKKIIAVIIKNIKNRVFIVAI